MNITLPDIKRIYGIDVVGVVHVGGHIGQEAELYKGVKVIFFEPCKKAYDELVRLHGQNKDFILIDHALGNFDGLTTINISSKSNGQSNSILEPYRHLEQYPDIEFDDVETVFISKLDTFEPLSVFPVNMMNIDTQGYELEVLKGAEFTLRNIDIIYIEVNFVEMYKGCVLLPDLDKWLNEHGFARRELYEITKTWGEAIYTRTNKNS